MDDVNKRIEFVQTLIQDDDILKQAKNILNLVNDINDYLKDLEKKNNESKELVKKIFLEKTNSILKFCLIERDFNTIEEIVPHPINNTFYINFNTNLAENILKMLFKNQVVDNSFEELSDCFTNVIKPSIMVDLDHNLIVNTSFPDSFYKINKYLNESLIQEEKQYLREFKINYLLLNFNYYKLIFHYKKYKKAKENMGILINNLILKIESYESIIKNEEKIKNVLYNINTKIIDVINEISNYFENELNIKLNIQTNEV